MIKHMKLILFFSTLLIISACSQSGSSNQLIKRSDSITPQTERRDLEQHLKVGETSFKNPDNALYSLTATVTLAKEEDATRIIYDIKMNNFKSELKNVIQSFTLDPRMTEYVDAPDFTNSNAENDMVTDLRPGGEPVALRLGRGYVLRSFDEWPFAVKPSYLEDLYIKISFGPNDDRTEDYWHIRAVPSSELTEFMNSKK